MKQILAAALNEYTVNNVRYEVVSAFKEYGGGNGTEDLADKVKRLILSEEILVKK